MNRSYLSIVLALVVPIGVALCGCGGSDGPELAEVEGTITFGGKPLVGATVEFAPQKGGVTSFGRTDQQGHYVLFFSGDQQGARPGTYTVRIRLPSPEDESKARNAVRIPAQYNTQSTVTATVELGKENRFDYNLQ